MTATPSAPSAPPDSGASGLPPDGSQSGSRTRRRAAWAAALVPAALVLVDILVDKRTGMPAWAWSEWKVYLVGLLWSLSFWAALLIWGAWVVRLAGHRRVAAFVLAGLFGLWIGFAYFASYKYLSDMYHLPNVHILQFTLYESANAWELTKEVLRWWHAPLIGAGLFLSAWLLGNSLHTAAVGLHSVRALWRRLLHFGATAVLAGLSILALGWHRYQDPLPWDANWHRMFFQYGLMLGGNTTNLRVAQRNPLPAHPGKPRHNVLVILNESLRADAVLPQVKLWEGFADTLSPRMLRRVMSDSQYRVFTRAYANAGATNASVPSLATGLPPEAGTYDYHRHPTFWNYAKSLGYRTFLFTPQDWRWEHFDEYFIDRDLDHAVHRRDFPQPLVNDLGVDDGLVVDSLLGYLRRTPRNRPFFGVIQFNITHPPFYGGAVTSPMPILSRERYRPTMDLLDRYQDRLLSALDSLGLLDSTLIVYTADHGENIRSRNLGRLGSFYDESLRVPFWIKPPKDSAWIEAHAAKLARLGAWTDRVVQNLDILPTLLDFWDLPVRSPWGAYAGRSLFGPGADSVRVTGAQNTGEIRAWSPEGCFVLRPPMKLVLANHTPPQLFDIDQDPGEQVNLWDNDSLRAANLPWISAYLRAEKGRVDLCRRLGENCPDELRTGIAAVTRKGPDTGEVAVGKAKP